MTEKLLVGNCLETLKELKDNSIDSVVTDPPYELGFMGKSWDSTGIAFNVKVWQECMRVLKPGGHLLAFSGSRTYHRMAVAIEDAGFEIRDQIMWIYGSGFPKSMNISVQIDKQKNAKRNKVKRVRFDGKKTGIEGGPFNSNVDMEYDKNPNTPEAKQWQGWGTALKPAHEPIVVARKPISEKTVAENVLTYGTGAINIDGSRVSGILEGDPYRFAKTDGGWAVANFNDAPVVRNSGRFPANLILSHNPDCQEDIQCTEGCPFLEFPNSKSSKSIMGAGYNDSNVFGTGDKNFQSERGFNDEGTAARFFYCAKASKSERNAGLSGLPMIKGGSMNGEETRPNKPTNHPIRQNFHPTVKPLTLMRYLIKLVTPPKGTVLDPFLGSGTTAVAATLDGFNWIGCELTDDYLPIINGRVEYAKAEVAKAKKNKETIPTLFEEGEINE